MITMNELLGNKYKLEDQTDSIQTNLNILLNKANQLRTLWGKPMVITSGLRDRADQIRIYTAKGVTDESKMHMGSMHFRGSACDISDPDGSLKKFVKANDYKILVDIGLWMEAESATPNWLHIQTAPPLSRKREFMP